jgi:DNA-binding PadR family transcriptional regulator
MYPFEFEYLYWLRSVGPSTAAQIAEIVSRPTHQWPRPGRSIANQLRRLVDAGFVEHGGGKPIVYRLTDRGREYVDA